MNILIWFLFGCDFIWFFDEDGFYLGGVKFWFFDLKMVDNLIFFIIVLFVN